MTVHSISNLQFHKMAEDECCSLCLEILYKCLNVNILNLYNSTEIDQTLHHPVHSPDLSLANYNFFRHLKRCSVIQQQLKNTFKEFISLRTQEFSVIGIHLFIVGSTVYIQMAFTLFNKFYSKLKYNTLKLVIKNYNHFAAI